MNTLNPPRLPMLAHFALALFFEILSAVAPSPAPAQAPLLQNAIYGNWGAQKQSPIVTCLAVDQGDRLWVGTEDTGVWVLDPSSPTHSWINYASATGLSDDDCFALLCDHYGRMWAGTDNHGVSVYAGGSWKNYDQTNGPLGDRVFALAESPVDHDVWIATENGLSRYSESTRSWRYYTAADGLPSNQVSALAFDAAGTLYAGTRCDGIGVASAADDYKTWRAAAGPLVPPTADAGTGQASAMANCLAVGADGTVYVGSDGGLSASTDKGDTWRYIRGGPADIQRPPGQGPRLFEDYIDCISADQYGLVWLGHRSQGIEAISGLDFANAAKSQSYGTATSSGADYITALLPYGTEMLVGTYGGGLRMIDTGEKTAPPANGTAAAATFPAAATAPTAQALAALAASAAGPSPMTPGQAYHLDEDWDSEGDSIGRYGRQFTVLCGTQQRGNFTDDSFGDGSPYGINVGIGPNHTGYGGYWMYVSVDRTQDPTALYDPLIGDRRQSEWNDGGQNYPLSADGPDLTLKVTAPPGLYKLTLYFVNNDGDSGVNRFRDYLITVRSTDTNGIPDMTVPPAATARVAQYRRGVYQSFVLAGPGTFDIDIAKNHSFNVKLNGVMLDKLSPPDYPPADTAPGGLAGTNYGPPPVGTIAADGTSVELAALQSVWTKLDAELNNAALAPLQQPLRLLCLRSAIPIGAPPDVLANWRWFTHTWTPDDRRQFDLTMLVAHKRIAAQATQH